MTEKNQDPQSVGDVLDRLKELGEEAGQDKAKLGDAVEAMGHRAYGCLLYTSPSPRD